MVAGRLPEDGELRIGPARLPTGQRVARAGEVGDTGEAVAWITIRAVADAGRAWLALSKAHQLTGLVPMLLADSRVEETEGFFSDDDAVSSAELDRMDAAGLLRTFWDEALPNDESDGDGPRLVQARAPFSREFPGLAPGEDTPLSPDRLDAALSSLQPARVGLVAADRPADALAQIGWGPFDPHHYPLPNALWIGAVLRSWEDRFGARLLNVGPRAEIRLLVERPPRSLDAARRIAAEHYVFGDECDGCGALSTIPRISASIINAPIWTFWWD